MDFCSQRSCEAMLREILEVVGPNFALLSIPGPSTLEDMSEKTRSLWLSSTSSIPQLLESSQSWRGRDPLVRELVSETLQVIGGNSHTANVSRSESQLCVNHQGEVDEDVDPHVVISQLVDADPNKPVFLTGLRLPIIKDLGYRVPIDICKVAEPFYESNEQVNLTPTYSFVDLHIDYGTDGVATPIGDCRKIWLLYPPTTRNLSAMKAVDGQRLRLARLVHELEGCVVVETTSAHAIYIPAASLHATFTLQGGFLIAKDFTTSRSLTAFAELLATGLEESLLPEARARCFEWFERCLEISLAHQKTKESVCAWLRAEAKLASWAATQRGWRVSVRRIWDGVSLLDSATMCECGRQVPESSFAAHFTSAHLSFLFSTSQLRHGRR